MHAIALLKEQWHAGAMHAIALLKERWHTGAMVP